MSKTNLQVSAVLSLVATAFADLANAASESGNEQLNEMFNGGGVAFEAAEAVRALGSKQPDAEMMVDVAMNLLRVAKHPLADLYDAQKAGELYILHHSFKHGDGLSLARFSADQDVEKTLNTADPGTYEIDRENEYVDVTLVGKHFEFQDFTDVVVPADDTEEDEKED